MNAPNAPDPVLPADDVAGRTYLVTIEVEVTIPADAEYFVTEHTLEDKHYWTVAHLDYPGDIASVSITDHLDHGEHNDGNVSAPDTPTDPRV